MASSKFVVVRKEEEEEKEEERKDEIFEEEEEEAFPASFRAGRHIPTHPNLALSVQFGWKHSTEST